MATRPLALPLVLLLVSLAAVDAAGPGGRGVPGGWNRIDVGTPNIQELGRWALRQAEQAGLVKPGLQFYRVVWGEEQVVQGWNSHLMVDVTGPSKLGRSTPYVAYIFDPVGTSPRQLNSFKPVSCAY